MVDTLDFLDILDQLDFSKPVNFVQLVQLVQSVQYVQQFSPCQIPSFPIECNVVLIILLIQEEFYSEKTRVGMSGRRLEFVGHSRG